MDLVAYDIHVSHVLIDTVYYNKQYDISSIKQDLLTKGYNKNIVIRRRR
jgi:hypothetical protein